MESPAIARCVEPEVIEIAPPLSDRRSKMKSKGKQKEVAYHEIIDVDIDDDHKDVVFLEGNVESKKMRKRSLGISIGPRSPEKTDSKKFASSKKGKEILDHPPNDFNPGSIDFFDLDESIFHDDYAAKQSRFDSLRFSAGIETPFPYLDESVQNYNPANLLVPSNAQSEASASQLNRFNPWFPSNKSTAVGGHSTYFDPNHFISQTVHSNFSSTFISTIFNTQARNALKRYKSLSKAESSAGMSKLVDADVQKKYESLKKLDSFWGNSDHYYHRNPSSLTKQQPPKNWAKKIQTEWKILENDLPAGNGPERYRSLSKAESSSGMSKLVDADVQNKYKRLQKDYSDHYYHLNPSSLTKQPPINWVEKIQNELKIIEKDLPGILKGWEQFENIERWGSSRASNQAGNGPIRDENLSKAESSSGMSKLVDADVQKKYESFKKFDTAVDYSDHYYYLNPRSLTKQQPPKNWAKKIQTEWKILENDLPDTIFVRVYESRMDLLRAVIIGAEGTPYHDGLFFFDVCFPSNYPNSPPLVHYHSGGLRINPNLYNCGKVCLSLLNTWSGGQQEKWLPHASTMLQVLVSIQGLILNMKPYFNEPGHERLSGSAHGEQSSISYNENTLILSLKTMVYTMNNPPKNFEDLVIGHFQHRVRDILMSCKAYTEGVQVGCLVKGVQDVEESSKSCSLAFRRDVGSYVEALIAAFMKIGAKQVIDFVSLSIK